MHGCLMRPPLFTVEQRLSDWPACWLEVRCPCLARMTMLPVRLLLEQGDRSFKSVLAALRCRDCRGRPAPVYLIAGHSRTFGGAGQPDWAVELVPADWEPMQARLRQRP